MVVIHHSIRIERRVSRDQGVSVDAVFIERDPNLGKTE